MNIIKQLIDADGNNIYPIAYAQGGVKMTELWTNPQPTSVYGANTISNIDIIGYDLIYTTFKLGTTNDKSCFTLITSGDRKPYYALISDGNARAYRIMTLGDSSVAFTIAYQGTFGSSVAEKDNYVIPYQIFGIKFSWVVPTTVQGLQYIEV